MSKRLDEAEWKLDCLSSRIDAASRADAAGYVARIFDADGRMQTYTDVGKAKRALVKTAEALASRAPRLPGSKWLVQDARQWDGARKFQKGLTNLGEILAFAEG